MKAIILAAGRGSRMGQLTQERPKCQVEFRGRSLLEWQRAALTGAGISSISIVTGYLGETLADSNLVCFENERWSETNMVRSLQCADAWLSAEPCIVSYSDIFYEAEAISTLIRTGSQLAVLYDVNWRSQWEARFADPLSDAETFRLSSTGRIIEIGKRARSLEEIQGQYMGLLFFTPSSWARTSMLLAGMSSKLVDDLSMTELLSRLIGEGEAVSGVPYDGVWGEIDSPADIRSHESRLF